jgi:hypothetical protein
MSDNQTSDNQTSDSLSNPDAFKVIESAFNRGFTIRFGNGVIASVRFGDVNYSDHGRTTAEFAAFRDNGEWVMINGEEVTRAQTPEEVAYLLSRVSMLHPAAGEFYTNE